MSALDPVSARVRLPPLIPVLARGVVNQRGQLGALLRAPHQETLAWDLENDIASTGCEWIEEKGGWWIADSYFQTAIDVTLRSFPSVLVTDPRSADRLVSRDEDLNQ